jgi:hypothetical protein
MRQEKNYEVRKSPVHGNGVFARRFIDAGERIIEYRGERISWDDATQRAAERGGPINHTFYFSLHDGRVIDGGRRGNDARWINHACSPNCEAYEEDGRVYIHALHPIEPGRGAELQLRADLRRAPHAGPEKTVRLPLRHARAAPAPCWPEAKKRSRKGLHETIVRSLLETDLYKFTMWQALLHMHPNAPSANTNSKCRTSRPIRWPS